MPRAPIGSVWSVQGFEDAAVVVLAGPFATSRGAPEYLIAPLYTGLEPGFLWTDEDVRLEDQESGLPGARFAAIWNARPVHDADLVLQLSTLNEEATVAVRDVYWASLNERTLGKSPRLGKPIRNPNDPAAHFQDRELKRWVRLSGRVLDLPEPSSAHLTLRCGDVWTLTQATIETLSNEMASSESLLGTAWLEGIGHLKAWVRTSLLLSQSEGPDVPTDLFMPTSSFRVSCEAAYVVDQNATAEHRVPAEMAANQDLAAAA